MKAILKESGKEVEVVSVRVMISEPNERNQINVTCRDCRPDQIQFCDQEYLDKVLNEYKYVIMGLVKECFSEMGDKLPGVIANRCDELCSKYILNN